MLNRIFLTLLLLTSIVWLTYVTSDILSDKNKFRAEELFGSDDEELLIVQQIESFDLALLTDFSESPSLQLFSSLNTDSCDQAFISKKRAHLLLIRNDLWDDVKLARFFKKNNASWEKTNLEFRGYRFRFHKTALYFWKEPITYSGNLSELAHDSNADASLIAFHTNDRTTTCTDIYLKGDQRYTFITRNNEINPGKKVSDKTVFANYVSDQIDSYLFRERDYYGQLDSVFRKGPMFRWIQHGFLELDYLGERVFVSDFRESQEPHLVLQEMNQTYDTNRFQVALTEDYPKKGSSYTYKYVDNLVIIAKNGAICDQFLADYKLGRTVALNPQHVNQIYGNLPARVSERFVSNDKQYTKTAYAGKLLESHTGQTKRIEQRVVPQSSISLSLGEQVLDFELYRGKGNAVALGASGSLVAFENGKARWKKNIEGEIESGIQSIDFLGNGINYTLLNTKKQIHLISPEGNNVKGFPITLDQRATNQVKFYRWKGKSYFLIGIDGGVVQYDATGRRMFTIKSNGPVLEQIDVWVSNKMLFAGIRSGTQFDMFDLDRRRSYRTFSINTASKSLKIANELLHFSVENGDLIRIDQKGNRTVINSLENAQLLKIISLSDVPTLAVKTSGKLVLVNSEGRLVGEIQIPFSDIADLDVMTTNSGKTIVAVVDALENNVYLYSPDGKTVLDKHLEGSKKVRLVEVSAGKQITTILDEYIIQYFEN